MQQSNDKLFRWSSTQIYPCNFHPRHTKCHIHTQYDDPKTVNHYPPSMIFPVRQKAKWSSWLAIGYSSVSTSISPSKQFAQLTQRTKQIPEHPRPNANNRFTYNSLPIQSDPRINAGCLHASSRIFDHELLIKTSNWSNHSATAEFSALAAPFCLILPLASHYQLV